MSLNEEQINRIARALADPKRMEIVSMIAREGEMCCGEIVRRLGVAQPTASHHLKELVLADLLVLREDKQYNFFSIEEETFRTYLAELGARILTRVAH